MIRKRATLHLTARLAAGVFFAVLAGCSLMIPQSVALRDAWPTGLPDRVELVDVPFFPQEEYQCGPAALATTLVHAGVRVTPEELVGQVYLPARKGSLQVEMLAAPRRHGLVSYQLAPSFEDLLREVAAGNPVIVLIGYGVGPFRNWHYADVVGYDRGESQLILRSGTTERRTIPFPVFEYTWKESGRWAMVTLGPDRIPATAAEAAYLEAVAAAARVAPRSVAVAAYRSLLRRWPENAVAPIGLANAHHAAGELKEAEVILRTAAERHPDSVPILNNLAQTLSDLGRHAEALKVSERAMRDPGPYAAAVRETHEAILRRMKRK